MLHVPGKLEARGCQQGGMLCNDKVLVLVHHQQSAVVDLASIVLHPKAVWGPFGGIKPWHAI